MPFESDVPEPVAPLACTPGAIPEAERAPHLALLTRLFRDALLERREVPGGYAFRFGAGEFAGVVRFVANERRCCPFLTFVLEIAPSDGPLWLHLTGPSGTRAFLDAELPMRP